jgi:poly-gamma-glutamate synthesis protein (capsule biosynthesis protein)
MERLRAFAEHSGLEARRQREVWVGFRSAPRDPDALELLGHEFVVRSAAMEETESAADDLAGYLESVAEARRYADVVIASLHTHEFGRSEEDPPAFVEQAAHAFIDAGASVVVGHGPHLLRGIEVYRSRPIFYSLGNFIFTYELGGRIPGDQYSLPDDRVPSQFFDRLHRNGLSGFPADRRYWETVVPVCEFQGSELGSVRLIPVELGFGLAPARRGIPRVASGPVGEEILRRMADLSAKWQTRIPSATGEGAVALFS